MSAYTTVCLEVNFLNYFCTCLESLFYCYKVRSAKTNDLSWNMISGYEVRSAKINDLSGNMISGYEIRSAKTNDLSGN
jgi:hypothetical protein